jgi:hypothetical protein
MKKYLVASLKEQSIAVEQAGEVEQQAGELEEMSEKLQQQAKKITQEIKGPQADLANRAQKARVESQQAVTHALAEDPDAAPEDFLHEQENNVDEADNDFAPEQEVISLPEANTRARMAAVISLRLSKSVNEAKKRAAKAAIKAAELVEKAAKLARQAAKEAKKFEARTQRAASAAAKAVEVEQQEAIDHHETQMQQEINDAVADAC